MAGTQHIPAPAGSPPAAAAAAATAAPGAPTQPVVGVVAPASTDPNIDFVSVGALLGDASAQLAVGEMVMSSGFSLFDAMSAVEIGNPKMDFGARPKSTSAALGSRPPPLGLSKAQLISWMDRLAALEATWHIGGALAQTVYASLHMMQLDRTTGDCTIAGFCRALHATCQEVNNLVLQGCVCEEEDFMVYAVGLPLEGSSEASDAVLAGLAAAGEPHDTRSAAAKGAAAAADSRLSAAVAARLALRKQFYQALLRLRGRTKQDLDAAAKHLARAAVELATVRASADLGAVAADAEDAAWAALGFDPAVNAHLAPPMPPRVCKVVTRDEAFDYYERLFEQLQRACRVTSVADWASLEAFVVSFSTGRPTALSRAALHFQVAQQPTFDQAASTPNAPPPPQPLPPGAQLWAPSAAMIVEAVACLAPGGPPLGDDADMFVEQALIAGGNWVQAVLLNPPRHRRRLRRGLEDWCHLYQHAINADCSDPTLSALMSAGWNWDSEGQYPEPLGPFSCWVERATARIVATHLLMGFELELYEPRDYAMIYWYIDYLYGVVESDCQVLARARPKLAATDAAAKSASGRKAISGGALSSGGKAPKGLGLPAAKGAGKTSNPAAVASRSGIRAALSSDQSQAAQAAALRLLCQGMMNMLVGLSAAGILVLQPLPFNGPEERFEQRFGFLHITTRPTVLQYSDFAAAVDLRGASPDAVLQAASMAFAKAGQMVKALGMVGQMDNAMEEHSKECAALERVATQNRLACIVAARAAVSGTSLDVSFEFTQHKSFPVVLLKSRK